MFEPENGFERRLVEAVREPASRSAFVAGLLRETVHVALFPTEEAAVVIEPVGRSVEDITALLRSIDRDGVTSVPMFSAPSRIGSFTTLNHVALPIEVRTLFERFPDKGFVLNPGSDYGKVFLPEEVQAMLRGASDGWVFFPGGTNYIVMLPDQDTRDLEAALAAHFAGNQAVAAAYVSQIAIGEAAPNLLLEVVVDGCDDRDVPTFASIVKRFTASDRFVDIVIRESAAAVLAKDITKPFYIRKKRSLFG